MTEEIKTTVAAMPTFTHKMVVDQEPVNILGAAPTRKESFAQGRGESFFVVQSARGKFIAHKNDLHEIRIEVAAPPRSKEERDERGNGRARRGEREEF